VDRHRLRACVRSAVDHRRQAGRHVRPAQDLRDRPRDLLALVARLRARAERRLPDRRARGSGHRRRA